MICQQILDDITFLSKHRLMDYSLLLITEKNPDFREDSYPSRDTSAAVSAKALDNQDQYFTQDRMSVIPEENDDEHDLSANKDSMTDRLVGSQKSDFLQMSGKQLEERFDLNMIKNNAQNTERKLTTAKKHDKDVP